MTDAERQPRWLFRTMRTVEFVAVVGGIFMLGVELYDRQEERAVRKASMLSALARLQLEHGKDASAALRSSLEVLANQGVDLRGFNLSGLELQGSNLVGGKLSAVDFAGTFLGSADLSEADLSSANFEGAYMPNVVLADAVLTHARMEGAYLARGNLSGAKITNTRLRRVGLDYADLSGAVLTEANVSGADLRNVQGLIQAQLDQACVTDRKSPPKLPTGLTAPQKQCDYE